MVPLGVRDTDMDGGGTAENYITMEKVITYTHSPCKDSLYTESSLTLTGTANNNSENGTIQKYCPASEVFVGLMVTLL